MNNLLPLPALRASLACACVLFVLFVSAYWNNGPARIAGDPLGCVIDDLPLPTNITKVTVQSSDPGYPAATGVTKTGSPVSGDLVVVDLIQQGTTAQGKVLVVLRVRANNGMTATFSGGKVTISGSGNGATHYVIVELATGDAANWTVDVATWPGGSSYKFVKGNGG